MSERAGLAAVAATNGVAIQPAWGSGKILTELFEQLVEPTLFDPVFIIDHPIETSPLARLTGRSRV